VERQRGGDSCLGVIFVSTKESADAGYPPAHDKLRLAETPREDSLTSIRYEIFGGRPLSHERTVRQFMNELDHISGFKVVLRQGRSGYFLEGPAGERAALGDNGPNALLSPREQEILCENLGFDATLLGLNPRSDD